MLEEEPENQHDPFAIKVLAPSGVQIGYIPREYCSALKKAISAHVALECRVKRAWANGCNVTVTGTQTEERTQDDKQEKLL